MRRLLLTALAATLASPPLLSQTVPAVTAADYARAERFLAPNLAGLVVGGSVAATWLSGDRFWYRRSLGDEGAEFVLVDPVRLTHVPAFDHTRLAAASRKPQADPTTHGISPSKPSTWPPTGGTIAVNVAAKRWTCAVDGSRCQDGGAAILPAAPAAGRPRRAAAAPRQRAPARRQTGSRSRCRPTASAPRSSATGICGCATWRPARRSALTTDGVKYFGYATDNAGWSASDRAMVLVVARFEEDRHAAAGRAQSRRDVSRATRRSATRRCASRSSRCPAISVMAMLHRVIDRRRQRQCHAAADAARISIAGRSATTSAWATTTGAPTAPQLALASVSRDHKQAWVSVADAATGTVRKVFEETVADAVRVADAAGDVLWTTQRTRSGIRSATTGASSISTTSQTGALKNQITTGEGPVMQIAQRRREVAHGLVRCQRPGGGPGSVLPPLLSHQASMADAAVSLTPDDGTHTSSSRPPGSI